MIQVLPVDDLKEHEESVHCHCQPTIDWDDEIVIHNSYDKREIIEHIQNHKRRLTNGFSNTGQ